MTQSADALDPPREPAWSPTAWVMLTAFVLLGSAWFLLPEIPGARGSGNESAAVGGLKAIANAQVLFREGDKDRDGTLAYTGSLQQLGSAGPQGEQLIDSVLAGGVKQGYYFSMGTGRDPRFEFWAKASPTVPGETGDRYFAINMAGILYWSNHDFPLSDIPERGKLPQGVFEFGN